MGIRSHHFPEALFAVGHGGDAHGVGDHLDLPGALASDGAQGLPHGVGIVGEHGRDFETREMPVNDHKGPSGGDQLLHAGRSVLGGNHHEPFHVLFQERLYQPPELFGVFFGIAEEHRVSMQVRHLFQVMGDGSVKDIAHVGEDYAQRVGASLAEHAGGGAGTVVQPSGHFQDALLGGFAHAVFLFSVGPDAVVHDKGNQGDGNSGLLGYILDGDILGHISTGKLWLVLTFSPAAG